MTEAFLCFLGTRGRTTSADSSDEAERLLPGLPPCMLGSVFSFRSDLDFFAFFGVLEDGLGSAGEGGGT